MVGLSAKEKVELNSAILEYLINNGFQETAEKFEIEAQVQKPEKPNNKVYKKDILEKKWKGLAKLKIENMALEKLNK